MTKNRKSGSTRAVAKSAGRKKKTLSPSQQRAANRNSARSRRTSSRTRSVRAARSRPRSKADAERRLVAAQRQLAKALTRREVDLILEDSEQAVDLIEAKGPRESAVTGEALPASRELARIRAMNLFRAFRERHLLLRDAMTVKDVADLLEVGRQTPHDRAKAGTLLAIKDSGQLRFPAWQFDPEGPDGVVEGLPEVVQAMRGPISPLAKIRWFVTPKSLLADRTPLDALREGDVDNVVAEARAIGAS